MPYQHLWRKKRRFLLRTPNDCWAGAGGVPPCPRGAPGPDPPPARRDRRSPRPGPWREPSAGPRGAHCSLRGDFTLGLLPRFPPSISFSPRLKELLERSGKRFFLPNAPERNKTKAEQKNTSRIELNPLRRGKAVPRPKPRFVSSPALPAGAPRSTPGRRSHVGRAPAAGWDGARAAPAGVPSSRLRHRREQSSRPGRRSAPSQRGRSESPVRNAAAPSGVGADKKLTAGACQRDCKLDLGFKCA